eukprot:5751943-Amphidinium_carterae.1
MNNTGQPNSIADLNTSCMLLIFQKRKQMGVVLAFLLSGIVRNICVWGFWDVEPRAFTRATGKDGVSNARELLHVTKDQEDKARAINVKGPEAVAIAALVHNAKLVVYSTEYVWDGTAGPYSEVAR